MAPSKYIDDPVPLIGAPPYQFRGVTSFNFYLGKEDAGRRASRALITKYLNEPLGCSERDCIYHSSSETPHPLLTLSIIKASSSRSDPSREISYREVALQIPVVISDPEAKQSTTGFFPPALFIDGPDPVDGEGRPVGCEHATSPIVIGRELYGLPKVPAAIDIEFSGTRLISATVEYFGKTLISAKGGPPHARSDADHERTREERLALAERLFGEIRKPEGDDWSFGITNDEHAARVDLLYSGHPHPLIGLRQFRHPCRFAEAVGRAVIESPYQISPCDPSHEPSPGYPLGNKAEITISPALGEALGLTESPYKVERPTDGVVFRNACATFGDPQSTVVRPAP